MKIKCDAYKCEFSDHNTCVRRQMKIKEWKAKAKARTRSNAGNYELLNAMPPEFFGMQLCLGCEVGIKLYKEAKKNGDLLPVAVKKKKPTKMLESIRQINEYKSWTAARGW